MESLLRKVNFSFFFPTGFPSWECRWASRHNFVFKIEDVFRSQFICDVFDSVYWPQCSEHFRRVYLFIYISWLPLLLCVRYFAHFIGKDMKIQLVTHWFKASSWCSWGLNGTVVWFCLLCFFVCFSSCFVVLTGWLATLHLAQADLELKAVLLPQPLGTVLGIHHYHVQPKPTLLTMSL